jgi:NSS family neurotransmitter:Na+ symporter
MAKSNTGFSSSFGAIMAAAGSAIGLGNIWRFPYICGKYGGGAALILYLFFVFFIGMTLLLSELTIGRRTGHTPMKAYEALQPKRTMWRYVGLAGLITCFLILCIYLVISGWTLNYFWESVSGQLLGVADGDFAGHFAAFAASPVAPVVCLVVFAVLTLVIILGGVQNGIEKVSKILMPVLLVLVLVLCVRSLTLPGASKGLAYLFNPDFSKLTWEGVLAILGQALFSLSVGMGVMIVYGSYMQKDDNLFKSAMWITVCDTAIAVLAGVAIFPAVFAFGQDPAGGPGLVFNVLPVVFNSMGAVGSIVFGGAFFLLLAVAALTSAISLLEALTAWGADYGKKRSLSAILLTIVSCALAVLAAYSFDGGILNSYKLGDMSLFDWLDKLTGSYLPPVCALLTIIFFGWFMKKDSIMDELSNHGTLPTPWFKVFYSFLARFVAPAALLLVLLGSVFQAEFEVSTVLIVIALVLYFFVLPLGVAYVAKDKGRKNVLWYFLSIVLTPLFALLMLIALGDSGEKHRQRLIDDEHIRMKARESYKSSIAKE